MEYAASPYTHPDPFIVLQRYHSAVRFTAQLIAERRHVFSPIVHCHELAKARHLPTDAKFWWEYNEHMLRRSDRLLVLTIDGWNRSKGVTMERGLATHLNLPIEYYAEEQHGQDFRYVRVDA